MAAPKKNRFWELRSEHGRDTLFETPDAMWKAACEYFTWAEENHLQEVQIHAGKRMKVPKMRAFTIQGLCRYLDCNTLYFNQFEASLKNEAGEFRSEKHEGFSVIVTRIRETIFEQKFTGAAAGFLKENIIVRELGLADKSETKTTPATVHTTVDLTPEQVKAYNKALEEDF